MSQQLDKRVETAIKKLWLEPQNNDGDEAKAMLEEAAKEGNGDACFFLARCYAGECFIPPKFGFPENDALSEEYFNKSIELGSAIGMFGTQRVGGFKPRCGSFIHAPYSSLKEIWDAVNDLAESGQAFCQYMIGNAYYYGDCIEMLGYEDEDVNLPLIQSFQKQAIRLFEMSIEQGCTMAIVNLVNILSSGDYDMPIDKKRVNELLKQGAQLQDPYCECEYANTIKESNPEDAVKLYEAALSHGNTEAYYYLGKIYSFDGEMPQDLKKAKSYYEKSLEADSHPVGCKNMLGKIYFYGGDGIEPDYNKAFTLFKQTRSKDDWCSDMLGHCYLKGLGTGVDYAAARTEFLIYADEELSAIGLGEIYCYGLGVKQDIAKGMRYLNEFSENPRVKDIKSHFKKGLFGWKQIK